jgi:5'-nucleotidase
VNLIVQSEGYANARGETPIVEAFPRYTPEPRVAALVARYAKAAEPLKNRVVGRLTGAAARGDDASSETVLADLIADAQLAGARAAGLKADVALMNYGGGRTDLIPAADGSVTFGQIYAAQPFGNVVAVRSYTGRQLRAVLEQQFREGGRLQILSPSANLRYAFDASKPAGQRLQDVRIDGQPLLDDRVYRVATSNFLLAGGDGFTTLAAGTDEAIGPVDIEVLEAYLAAGKPVTPPVPDRIRNLTPKP